MTRRAWELPLNSEKQRRLGKAAGLLILALIILAGVVKTSEGQNSGAPPSKMAPLEQYLMDRKEEIGLAQSAAPVAISGEAAVMVLGRRGYEMAV